MDIVERLRFDAARCQVQFSKGVATNIEEAADEIERLRALLARYRDETPLGHQPHMIALEADRLLGRV